MSGPFLLWLLFIITIVFIVVLFLSGAYLLMGIKQIATGYKEQNRLKKKSGMITLVISFFFLLAAIITYLKFLFA